MQKRIFTLALLLMIMLAACSSQGPHVITPSLESTLTDRPTPVPPSSTALPVPTPTVFFTLDTIAMFDPLKGWAMAESFSVILRTLDGGHSWQDVTPQSLESTSSDLRYDLNPFFLDARHAWLIVQSSDTSLLLHTSDTGRTWSTVPLTIPGGALYFVDPQNGYLLGSLGIAAGSHHVALYATQDAGATWSLRFTHQSETSQSLPEGGAKSGMSFISPESGWITGNIPMEDFVYLYQTVDGGSNWAQVELPLPPGANRTFFEALAPVIVDPGSAFLPVRVLGMGNSYQVAYYRLTGGDKSWEFRSFVQNASTYDFLTTELGWVSYGTRLFLTRNGALTWVDFSAFLPTGATILQVDFSDDTHGWLLIQSDRETTLYRTTDGGQSWVLLQQKGTASRSPHSHPIRPTTGLRIGLVAWHRICPWPCCSG